MKRILVLLALATLVTGLLGSCKKDDIENPDPQSFEEVVKNLPGVYLSSTFYKMHGYGHIVSLNEDGTVNLYWFIDDDVENGVDIDDTYKMSGTWEAFEVDEQLNDEVTSKIALRMKLAEVTDDSPESLVDTTYLFTYNNRNCVYSTNFGEDEFVEFDEEYAKSTQKLEEYLRTRQEPNVFYGEDTDEESGTNGTDDISIFPRSLHAWMSELPDDIFLCDLTIPGSHDALSYRCENTAQTQTLKIADQFMCGSRYFDIRYYMAHKKVYPCHGVYRTLSSKNIKDDLILLEQCLMASPRECAIVMFCRNANDGNTEKDRQEWIEKNVFANSLVPYVPFRPDLRLGDVRGKIVVLTRDWKEYPGYDSWNSTYVGPINNPGGLPKKVFWYSQDYSEWESNDMLGKIDIFKKTAEPRNLVTKAPSPDKGFNDLKWSINYLSGYYKTYQPVQFASIVNPNILRYLKDCNNEKTFGIVPLDWIGRDKVNGGITEVWVGHNTHANEVVPALIKSNQNLIQWYNK